MKEVRITVEESAIEYRDVYVVTLLVDGKAVEQTEFFTDFGFAEVERYIKAVLA